MIDTAFIESLASKSPTPGGGGAAAYCGALAAALSEMVGSLTVGKATYANVEPDVQACMQRLEELRERLVHLIDADAAAFEPLAACYGMPRDTEEQTEARNSALQGALGGACDVPLEIMDSCLSVLDECRFMAQNGSKLAISDAGASAVLAHAACKAAALNVFINVSSMSNSALAQEYRGRATDMIDCSSKAADEIYTLVMKEIER